MSNERGLAGFVSERDELDYDGLVRRHGPMVYRVCRDILGDREHAEDAFQATFLVLVRQAGSIRDPRSIGRWLYEVALRISRRERRRLARLRSQERQAPAMEAAAPPDFDPADREAKPILHEEIGRLPARLRDAIVLCYFEGLTVDAAARRLGCPSGTIKSRLAKGREVLRSRLTRRGLAASVLLLLMFTLTEEASAAVPETLTDATIRAGSLRPGAVGASRRVALMVLEEEGRRGWFRTVGLWGLLTVLVFWLGAYRLSLARRAEAAESAPLAISPAAPWPGTIPTGAEGPVAAVDQWSAPETHCRGREPER